MNLWQKILNWPNAPDEQKGSMSRRAFMRGATITAAGLIVPTATVFDMGLVHKPFPIFTLRLSNSGYDGLYFFNYSTSYEK